VARATLVGEDDQVVSDTDEDQENFWQTSEGRFRFVIAELPSHLQFLHTMLTILPSASVSEKYQALQCIYLLALHGDVFSKAAKDHRGFFIWCQENLLIKRYIFTLWWFLGACVYHLTDEINYDILFQFIQYVRGQPVTCV